MPDGLVQAAGYVPPAVLPHGECLLCAIPGQTPGNGSNVEDNAVSFAVLFQQRDKYPIKYCVPSFRLARNSVRAYI